MNRISAAVRNFREDQGGELFILVLMLLLMGTLILTPAIVMSDTALKSKKIHTGILAEQYTRDAGAEFAMWDLIYGDAALLLSEANPEVSSSITLNGITSTITTVWTATESLANISSTEDDRVRPSNSVICDKDGDGFDDDCLALPKNIDGMVARYTIYLEQISPDTENGVTVVYDELPTGFSYIPGSTFSQDGSILAFEPAELPTSQNPVLAWDFETALGGPLLFNHGEVKQFSFDVNINKSEDRYCNAIYIKPNRELSGKTAPIHVSTPSNTEGCQGGGVATAKFVDTPVAFPEVVTVFTYIINVENVDTSTLHLDNVRDILPQGGFRYLLNSASYKITDTPFDPENDSFINLAGDIPILDGDLEKTILANNRQQLVWSDPGGGGDPKWSLSQAGSDGDTLIVRFEVIATLDSSGTYFNEVFGDVGAGCNAPQHLVGLGIFTPGQEDEEYCFRYSWPTSGVIVPSYDVQSSAGRLVGQGNADLISDLNSAVLNSWHLN